MTLCGRPGQEGRAPRAAEALTSFGREPPASRLSFFAGFSVPSLVGRSEGLCAPSAGGWWLAAGCGAGRAARPPPPLQLRGSRWFRARRTHRPELGGQPGSPAKTPLTATDWPPGPGEHRARRPGRPTLRLVSKLPEQFPFFPFPPRDSLVSWLSSLPTRASFHPLGLSPGDPTHPALGAGLRPTGP